jgi:hypothetical protein
VHPKDELEDRGQDPIPPELAWVSHCRDEMLGVYRVWRQYLEPIPAFERALADVFDEPMYKRVQDYFDGTMDPIDGAGAGERARTLLRNALERESGTAPGPHPPKSAPATLPAVPGPLLPTADGIRFTTISGAHYEVDFLRSRIRTFQQIATWHAFSQISLIEPGRPIEITWTTGPPATTTTEPVLEAWTYDPSTTE